MFAAHEHLGYGSCHNSKILLGFDTIFFGVNLLKRPMNHSEAVKRTLLYIILIFERYINGNVFFRLASQIVFRHVWFISEK